MDARLDVLSRIVACDRIHQRIMRAARRRMDDHARSLIHDEERLILIRDGERDVRWHDIILLTPRKHDAIALGDSPARIVYLLAIHRHAPIPFDPLPQSAGQMQHLHRVLHHPPRLGLRYYEFQLQNSFPFRLTFIGCHYYKGFGVQGSRFRVSPRGVPSMDCG